MLKLTPKQERFAQAIADGKTQADAYRIAYGVDGMKDSSIHVNASKLMADAKVSQRVEDLRVKLVTKALWNREMSVKALVNAYKVAQESKNSNGMTSAVKELNAMHGFNAPQKIDVSGELALHRIERVVIKP